MNTLISPKIQQANAALATNWYADKAQSIIENGFLPIPLMPGDKMPGNYSSVTGWQRSTAWTMAPIVNPASTKDWPLQRNGCNAGLGILLGKANAQGDTCFAIDIDMDDQEKAEAAQARVEAAFGITPLIRAGRLPRRTLFYRATETIRATKIDGIDLLGAGRQSVAYGIHPKTQMPYTWIGDEEPTTIALSKLPLITASMVERFISENSSGKKTSSPVADGPFLVSDNSAEYDATRRGNLDRLQMALNFISPDCDYHE
jgi:Bifunctional DNA primase/polymerase, N-terminal